MSDSDVTLEKVDAYFQEENDKALYEIAIRKDISESIRNEAGYDLVSIYHHKKDFEKFISLEKDENFPLSARRMAGHLYIVVLMNDGKYKELYEYRPSLEAIKKEKESEFLNAVENAAKERIRNQDYPGLEELAEDDRIPIEKRIIFGKEAVDGYFKKGIIGAVESIKNFSLLPKEVRAYANEKIEIYNRCKIYRQAKLDEWDNEF